MQRLHERLLLVVVLGMMSCSSSDYLDDLGRLIRTRDAKRLDPHLAVDPLDEGAVLAKCALHLESGEHALALEHIDRALHPIPTVSLLLERAALTEDLEQRLLFLNRALEIDSKEPMTLFQVWWCHFESGNFSDAEQTILAHMEADRYSPSGWQNLAATHAAQGQYNRAIEALERHISRNLSHEGVERNDLLRLAKWYSAAGHLEVGQRFLEYAAATKEERARVAASQAAEKIECPQPIDKRAALGWELERRRNHYVVGTVLAGSAAASAGVQPGDQLISVGGVDPGELQLLRAGEVTTLRYRRSGLESQVQVQVPSELQKLGTMAGHLQRIEALAEEGRHAEVIQWSDAVLNAVGYNERAVRAKLGAALALEDYALVTRTAKSFQPAHPAGFRFRNALTAAMIGLGDTSGAGAQLEIARTHEPASGHYHAVSGLVALQDHDRDLAAEYYRRAALLGKGGHAMRQLAVQLDHLQWQEQYEEEQQTLSILMPIIFASAVQQSMRSRSSGGEGGGYGGSSSSTSSFSSLDSMNQSYNTNQQFSPGR